MPPFENALKQRLDALRDLGLFRELRRIDSPQGPRLQIDGQTFLNFSSNDYLGLANHPSLKEAAIAAVRDFGAGAGASRLICGSLAPVHELEAALADFKQAEAALVFSTGYAAALGTITALAGKEDVIILDKLVHACIVDAARLSGATLRVFAHNDLSDLEAKLQWAADQAVGPTGLPPGILIITESVFSMDGDTAPLREIVALKDQYGAWLMVDEAHATGVLGEDGRGLAHQLGVNSAIEVQMGTLGKAIGAGGGFIAGRRLLIDYLINRARSFIFSTAPVPAAAAAALAGLRLAQSPEGQRRRRILRGHIAALNSVVHRDEASGSAIIPLIIGPEADALAAAQRLRDLKIFVPAIRYPTVARGAARLRITPTAAHADGDLAVLSGALQSLLNRHP